MPVPEAAHHRETGRERTNYITITCILISEMNKIHVYLQEVGWRPEQKPPVWCFKQEGEQACQ